MKFYPAFFLASAVFAQTAASHLPGAVTATNPAANQITIKTAEGELAFTTTERTQILHAAAGVSDPKQWPKMTLADISPGDEVVAYFRGSTDQKPLLATSLVVRTRADLGKLAETQLEDWKKRGTTGTAEAVDPAARTITLKSGQRTFTVQTGDKTQFHRYSPDSAKPSDARPSSLADIKPGDQVNVLGNRAPDQTIAAEVVYAGTFRQLAALINSIDAATGEMKVTDLATKKQLVIRIAPDTAMKKVPEPMAQMLARRYQGGGRGGASGEAPPAGRGGRGGDIGQMLDRLPAIQLADLKPKDAIMVSTTMGSDPGKVTAVMLLAGVEPILTAAPSATRDIMAGWNLGGGGAADQ